ncbi:MAG TPA: hypothetical protein VJM09_11235, partial [Sphingobium sp.]|nr:hypothetical protein [Sphingobium sp.]
MMYKAFAGLTLVAAPIIVFVAQNLVPQRPAETATAVQAAPAKPMPLTPPLPPATAPEPVSD